MPALNCRNGSCRYVQAMAAPAGYQITLSLRDALISYDPSLTVNNQVVGILEFILIEFQKYFDSLVHSDLYREIIDPNKVLSCINRRMSFADSHRQTMTDSYQDRKIHRT